MKHFRKFTLLVIFMVMLQLTPIESFGSAPKTTLELTPEEVIFIHEHPIIYLGSDPKFIPYEFFDTDGVYKGIAADYIKLLSERTGLTFEVEKNLTWEQAYEKAVLKQVDALPCVSKTAEREQFFLYSDPYYSFQRVIFVNETNKSIKNLADLANKKVAVQNNSSHHSYLKAFSSIELTPYPTVEEALKAVSDGKEVAFVGNFATSSYLIKDNGITNLKYITIQSEEKQLLYFAIRKDWPLLVSILNKGLADITEEEKIVIDNRWIGVQNKIDYSAIFKIAGIISAMVALVLVVSLYWIAKLRGEIETRKKIEADLKIAKEEAELANHIKSTFLARMSHEIRTPLNAITGMAYVMKKTDLTTTQKIYLEKITRAAKDMLGIINDILDFSKIEAGKIEIEKISFNLDEVLEQLINIVSFKIEEQKIDFSMHKDVEIPTFFWGDPKRIEQVLLNLVNNSLKFTQDGSVYVSIRLVAKSKDGYRLEFSIKDTGIGMSEEQLEQLFTPFNQADSSISRRFGGTGLGLSIVKNLVEMMGGTISVYSELGEGTTFLIQLTLEEDHNKLYEERKKSASLYFQNVRVLVVEKSLFYTNLIRDYLRSFGIVAEFAQSEDRAIQLLEDASRKNGKPYNLIIVDYETPAVGGIEFCKKVKLLPNIKEIPKTIVLIPLAQDDVFEKLETAGLDFGITKPIIPSVLYNGILEIFKFNVLEIHDGATQGKKEELCVVDYPYHVLVVEDNKTNQFIAKSILELAGFKVSLTDNGKEGYEFFGKNRESIHIILMDLHMPVMNGFESTELIRKIDKEIPIIAMTADAITGIEEKCKAMGIDHYISKPFEPEKFVESVIEVVKAQSSLLIKENSGTEIIGREAPLTRETSGVLDETEGMKFIGGNRELYFMILKEYYNENKDVPALLDKTIEAKEYKEAVQIVHKIKSSTGSIGAKTLYATVGMLQKALAAEDADSIKALHLEFDALLKKVLMAIEEKITYKN